MRPKISFGAEQLALDRRLWLAREEVKQAQKQPGRRAWRAQCQTRGARLQNA
ncbi:hypothetical protein [Snodgrassella gandavensis]|uniref:hypothetical protein n=1 Tax=Snodgrassella gandavensis TaxID=2946698 RepID=UPI001EF64FD0|nr:hypothetical protein [Snodgrassella gandavensis]